MTPEPALKHVRHSYREGSQVTELSTIDVWLPESNSDGKNTEGIWVVFIHGGAWRDPLIDSISFKRTVVNLILSPPPTTSGLPIVGYASLNYRLSPYPSHPTHPSSPSDASRSAKHPDHIDDVTAGMLLLEKTYCINGRYLLAGHSCGATLAFQLPEEEKGEKLPVPKCIIGSEGIYDIPSLLERNRHPFYRDFVTSAFGDDEEVWTAVSPTTARAEPRRLWEGVEVLLISHSEEDEYVEKEQSVDMLERIKREVKEGQEVSYVEARGRHDEVHEKGGELARIIGVGIGRM